jgi:hypothetical protein
MGHVNSRSRHVQAPPAYFEPVKADKADKPAIPAAQAEAAGLYIQVFKVLIYRNLINLQDEEACQNGVRYLQELQTRFDVSSEDIADQLKSVFVNVHTRNQHQDAHFVNYIHTAFCKIE